MGGVFRGVGVLLNEGKIAMTATIPGFPRSCSEASHYQIAAMDRQHTVVLWHPAVAMSAMT